MPYVESTILIDGAPADVYAIACDMESYPRFMPDVESVKVLEKADNRTVTEWVTSVDGTPLVWTEEDLFDDQACRITYRLIEGDLDKFEGSWSFNQTPQGTQVTLGVDFDFGIPNLTELIGPTLEVKVRENSEMMLRAMKGHVEARKQTTA